MSDLQLFSTSQCPRCVKLSKYLASININFTKRVIDEDPEAETDALMLNIFAAPALRKDDNILRGKDIFKNDEVIEAKVKEFIGI